MSFSQGLSGLNASSKDLEVIGNNVANANTVGFKQSQAQFGDVFAAALSGSGSAQIGIGVKVQTVAQQFSQGNISNTNNTLDMAINGPGFFVVDTGHGTGYSRNGQFQLDKNGFIVSSAGHKLLGYQIDPKTSTPIAGQPTPLTVPTAVASALATGAGTGVKGISAGLNLDSRTLPPTLPFDPTDPRTFYQAVPSTTYDSKGVAQTTTMYFVKQSVNLSGTVNNPLNQGAIVNSSLTAPITTTVTPASGVAGLKVGQPIVGAGFPTGTTIASIGSVFNTSVTAGTNAITPPIATMSGLKVGQAVSGTNVPANTTIASLTGGSTQSGGVYTVGKNTVTLPSTTGLVVGQPFTSGTDFPAGTTITNIDNTTTPNPTLTLSSTAKSSSVVGGATMTFGPTGFTISNPFVGTSNTSAQITVDSGTFTTSNAYTGAVSTTLPYSNTSPVEVLADVANQWQVFTQVTDPTTGATLFPLPAPAAGQWRANGILQFGPDGRVSQPPFLPNTAANNVGGLPAYDPTNLPAGVISVPSIKTTSITFTPTGASQETIPFDFSASTQFGASFGVNTLQQDGYTSGQLSGFSISPEGLIQGRYSNGVTNPLGQVSLATFPNNQGLQPLGSNEWAQTAASGSPVINAAGSGNNGVLQTSATEDSNVDLTAELVHMITAQRVYQANAQTIKTQDAVMQTLVNLR